MPAGIPYFAWIDASETTFTSGHMRWDEQVFSFELKQDEGDPASLTLVVRRPKNVDGDAIGLLGPGRKIWCWFALDCGPSLVKFRGRLVGVPTSIFEELVTLEFVARPADMVAQKQALAESLKVLPYYDETVVDEARRNDPEVVLEGYTKIWTYNPESHLITVSDEIFGEDGLVEFDGTSEAGKVLYDGLGLSLPGSPLSRVDIVAEYNWTQLGGGNVDLTNYIIDNSPHMFPGCISSFTLTADNWPKFGASLGSGWKVASSTCYELYDLTTFSFSTTETQKVIFGDGNEDTLTTSSSYSRPAMSPPGSVDLGFVYTEQWQTSFIGGGMSGSFSRSTTTLAMHHIKPTLIAGYAAQRPCTERVSFTLFADMQSIVTDPEDGEAMQITDIKSVDLSEPIAGVIPIGDARRRSYIATPRGNQSLEHLIALARAHLMKRARMVEITCAPKLSRMPEVTLRKNAFLIEPRIGEAFGKIIGYSIALDGSDGRINCEIRIGCAIGRGGSQALTVGTPTYCTVDYVGADYQQFNDRLIGFTPTDTSVGYQPPTANPNDDGINFLAPVRVEDVIDIPLYVENPYSEPSDGRNAIQQLAASARAGSSFVPGAPDMGAAVAFQVKSAMDYLAKYPTRLIFKLKSMTREFTSDYEIQVTDLKIPTGYDLEKT